MKKLDLANVQEQIEGKPFHKLPVGGYVCAIMGVLDDPDGESLRLEVQIVEGEESGYYTKTSQSNQAVRYGYLFQNYGTVTYKDGTVVDKRPQFKAFVTSVEHSNPGFKWDGQTEHQFLGKRVGVVFGEREYMANDGTVKTGVNPRFAISVERVKNGDYTIPPIRKLPQTASPAPATFTEVTQERLPWENL